MRPPYTATGRPTLKDWILCGVIGFGLILTAILALTLLFGAVWVLITVVRQVVNSFINS